MNRIEPNKEYALKNGEVVTFWEIDAGFKVRSSTNSDSIA